MFLHAFRLQINLNISGSSFDSHLAELKDTSIIPGIRNIAAVSCDSCAVAFLPLHFSSCAGMAGAAWDIDEESPLPPDLQEVLGLSAGGTQVARPLQF